MPGILLLCFCSIAVVADDELPEIEFLEYLGLWEESDDEWVMFNDPIATDEKEPRRNGPAPDGKEPMEKPDEN